MAPAPPMSRSPSTSFPNTNSAPTWRMRWSATSSSRRECAAEPRHLLPDLGRPEVHKLMDVSINKNMIDKEEYPQSADIERRCVHMLADLWNAPDSRGTIGCINDRLQRSLHAGRHGDEVELAGKRKAPGQADRPAQSGLWPRAGLLAQVRALLGRRAARDPHGARPLLHGRRRGCSARSTRTRSAWCPPSASPTPATTSPAPLQDALDASEADGARHRHSCRRRERRVPRALLRAGDPVGLPASAREVDQQLRP